MLVVLKNQGLTGYIEEHFNYKESGYIVRVYRDADLSTPLYIMSFGDGAKAEDRLLELMEHPAWTLLRFY